MIGQPLSLRILSYNIHKGFGNGIRKYTLEQMREEIRKIHPDMIFLQEVQGQHDGHKKRITNWPDASQFEYLAEELWPHFSYGKNVVYTEGHHGNAILSKFPILSWENIDVSQNPFEHRGLLHAVIRVSEDLPPLHAICAHLGLFESDRKKQVIQLVHRIESMVPKKDLVIAAGDFNDWRGNVSQPLFDDLGLNEAFLKLQGKHAKTFPSWLPVMRLDRVYYRGFDAISAACLDTPPWDTLSDHAALAVELVAI